MSGPQGQASMWETIWKSRKSRKCKPGRIGNKIGFRWAFFPPSRSFLFFIRDRAQMPGKGSVFITKVQGSPITSNGPLFFSPTYTYVKKKTRKSCVQ